jgi:hypothetical protein
VTWRSEHDVVLAGPLGSRVLCPCQCDAAGGPGEGEFGPEPTAPSERLLAAVARGIEETLGGGGLVLAGSAYFQTLTAAGGAHLRRRIEAVCARREPEALRIARVQAYGVRREAAVDLVRAARTSEKTGRASGAGR